MFLKSKDGCLWKSENYWKMAGVKVYVLYSLPLNPYSNYETWKQKNNPIFQWTKDGLQPQTIKYATHTCQVLWKVGQSKEEAESSLT